MTELQHRIMYREMCIIIAVIGCMVAFEYNRPWVAFAFIGYLMWSSGRTLTFISHKWKKGWGK